MKQYRTLGKALLLLLVFGLAACGNQENSAGEAAPVTGTDVINDSLETMSKLFAKGVSDLGVRQQIHSLVGERFDGDTNVLYQTLVSRSGVQEQSGMNLRQVLSEAYAQTATSLMARARASDSVDALAESIPRFQVAVPVHFDAWNPETETPLVGYMPVGVEDTTLKTIKAFDAEGNEYLLNAQVAPNKPVIILGVNERTDEAGNVLYNDTSATASADNAALETQSCIRNAYMNAVYLRDDNEPWTRGDPEIKMIATSRNYDLSYHGSFPDVNDEKKWYYKYRWLGCTSTNVVYYWYEDDGSGLDITASYGGFSLNVKIDDGDDFMGAVQVPYSYLNNTWTKWDLGDLVFYSN